MSAKGDESSLGLSSRGGFLIPSLILPQASGLRNDSKSKLYMSSRGVPIPSLSGRRGDLRISDGKDVITLLCINLYG